MKEDKFIKYLKLYALASGDINKIPRNTIVEFEGETLKVGEFLSSIRKQRRLYITGSTKRGCTSPLSKKRYEELDKLNFIWEPKIVTQQQKIEQDHLLEFVTNYYDQYHTFDNIPSEVIIDGKTYNIRNFINHVRANRRMYLNGIKLHGSASPTFIKRYEELDKRNFSWNPQQDILENDKPIQYLQEYYLAHQTLDGVPNKIIYQGDKINIQDFLTDRRKMRRRLQTDPNYQPSQLERNRWQALDEMEYDWDFFERRNQELLTNDPYIRYLRQHYDKYHTINNITAKQIVEFEGKKLNIGSIINECRKKHYAYTVKGIDTYSTNTPLLQKRYAALEEMGIDWRPSESRFSIAEYAREHGLRRQTLSKYLEKFNGNIEKATKFCLASRRHNAEVKKNKAANEQSLDTVMKEFDINYDMLEIALNKKALQTAPVKPTRKLMYDGKTNLRKYCIDNGLNYNVIQRAIKLKQEGLCDEELQSLINRVVTEYKHKGQNQTSSWIYGKYGNETLVRHLLLSMHLDADTILRDMSRNYISLEKAIENNSFVRKSTPDDQYLAPIYHDLVDFYNKVNKNPEYTNATAKEELVNYFSELVTEYELEQNEYTTIMSSLEQYVESIDTYRLYNVAFEHDQEKKVALIIQYQLDDDEIEEAFFLPLNFDKKVLIGRQSELYERRQLVKELTQKWNHLDTEAQHQEAYNNNLTAEELNYIQKTRQTIDETKAKVHSKRNK